MVKGKMNKNGLSMSYIVILLWNCEILLDSQISFLKFYSFLNCLHVLSTTTPKLLRTNWSHVPFVLHHFFTGSLLKTQLWDRTSRPNRPKEVLLKYIAFWMGLAREKHWKPSQALLAHLTFLGRDDQIIWFMMRPGEVNGVSHQVYPPGGSQSGKWQQFNRARGPFTTKRTKCFHIQMKCWQEKWIRSCSLLYLGKRDTIFQILIQQLLKAPPPQTAPAVDEVRWDDGRLLCWFLFIHILFRSLLTFGPFILSCLPCTNIVKGLSKGRIHRYAHLLEMRL